MHHLTAKLSEKRRGRVLIRGISGGQEGDGEGPSISGKTQAEI